MQRREELADIRTLHVPGEPARLESVFPIERFDELRIATLDHAGWRLQCVLQEHAKVLIEQFMRYTNELPGMPAYFNGELCGEVPEIVRRQRIDQRPEGLVLPVRLPKSGEDIAFDNSSNAGPAGDVEIAPSYSGTFGKASLYLIHIGEMKQDAVAGDEVKMPLRERDSKNIAGPEVFGAQAFPGEFVFSRLDPVIPNIDPVQFGSSELSKSDQKNRSVTAPHVEDGKPVEVDAEIFPRVHRMDAGASNFIGCDPLVLSVIDVPSQRVMLAQDFLQ